MEILSPPPPGERTLPARGRVPTTRHRTVLDVVVPVHNEQDDLERSVRRLRDHLRESFPYPFRITVADNASTDATRRIATALAAELPEVDLVRLREKGRGSARWSWRRARRPPWG